MSRFRLLSVPHSGTRFVRTNLVRAGFDPVNDFLQQHFTGHINHWIIYGQQSPAIIPIRPYKEVEKSWQRRGRYDPPLDQVWSEMDRFIAEAEAPVLLLHIEDPELRDQELQAIADLLDIEADWDWNEKVAHGDAWITTG